MKQISFLDDEDIKWCNRCRKKTPHIDVKAYYPLNWKCLVCGLRRNEVNKGKESGKNER